MATITAPPIQPTASSRIGGKGSVRRKVKRVQGTDHRRLQDKLSESLKKLGVAPVRDVLGVTFSHEELALDITSPEVSLSMQANVCVIKGNPEQGNPELVDDDAPAPEAPPTGDGKLNKHARKARKALVALGLERAAGLGKARMQMLTGGGLGLHMDDPEVMTLPGSKKFKTFVLFGRIRADDMKPNQAGNQVLHTIHDLKPADLPDNSDDDECPDLVEDFDVAPVQWPSPPAAPAGSPDSALDDADVELVMNQAGVNKNRATDALRQNNNDVVNAIMMLC